MTELIIPSEAPDLDKLKERRVDRIARRLILSLLKKLAYGRITIIENSHRPLFDRHKRSVDFIKRYIFPDSCISSITAIGNAIARATDLPLVHLEDITPHYASTLGEWRRRFFANIEKVRALGFSETLANWWGC